MSQLRAVLRQMSRDELENMICMLSRASDESAAQLESLIHSEEYVARLLSDCKQKLRVLFSYTNRSGILSAARRCVQAFAKHTQNEPVLLELMLTCLEGAMDWVLRTETPSIFGNDLIDMFTAFVERMNKQQTKELFSHLNNRITKLELEADMLGWSFGETLSEACLNIRWWGEG